jgi:hypothetical protein
MRATRVTHRAAMLRVMETIISESKNTQALPMPPRSGLVPSWISMGAGMVEGVIRSSFGAVSDVHHEATTVATATVEYAEQLADSAIRLSRALIARFEGLINEAVARGERAAHSVVGVLHEEQNGRN